VFVLLCGAFPSCVTESETGTVPVEYEASEVLFTDRVTFTTADGVTVHGDLYHRESGDQAAPVILLFHQENADARGEYGPLVSRLRRAGYRLLAIDQRRGGERLAERNRTVADLEGREFSYCDAHADLEAALAFTREHGFAGKVAAWGSGYSAALAIRLGAAHGDELDAVLAFSPALGDAMPGCPAEDVAGDLALPALVLHSSGEMQQDAVREQLDLFLEQGLETYVPDSDAHGSAMLDPARAGGDTDRSWNAVLAFLEEAFSDSGPHPEPPAELVEVATGRRRWTGIAVSRSGRVFVNYPRWAPDVPFSVGELQEDGRVIPYPDEALNRWTPEADARERFVCVQSVHVDRKDRLWILDPASPMLMGVVPGGAKLMRIDLATDSIVRTYSFGSDVAPAGSYLNDVRIDTGTETAFITDSREGALVVLDLETGVARRLLEDHPATQAEPIQVIIDGITFPNPVHADGIAIDADGGWLYFQALTGRTLYRAPTAALRDPSPSPDELAGRVERVAMSGVSDGLLFGPGGVYVSALESGSIRRVDALGRVTTVVKDPRIIWPDSFALAADGSVWFTTAQIHLGAAPPEPFRIFQITLPDG
jgi:sugar lactone lactonase YvrE